MLRLLRWLWFGRDAHEHVWEEFDAKDMVDKNTNAFVGKASFCKCQKCGERRIFKMLADSFYE